MITNFGKGEIKGWGAEEIYIARNPGESEEALATQAAAEARAHHNRQPSLIARAYRAADGPGIRTQDQSLALGLSLRSSPQNLVSMGGHG